MEPFTREQLDAMGLRQLRQIASWRKYRVRRNATMAELRTVITHEQLLVSASVDAGMNDSQRESARDRPRTPRLPRHVAVEVTSKKQLQRSSVHELRGIAQYRRVPLWIGGIERCKAELVDAIWQDVALADASVEQFQDRAVASESRPGHSSDTGCQPRNSVSSSSSGPPLNDVDLGEQSESFQRPAKFGTAVGFSFAAWKSSGIETHVASTEVLRATNVSETIGRAANGSDAGAARAADEGDRASLCRMSFQEVRLLARQSGTPRKVDGRSKSKAELVEDILRVRRNNVLLGVSLQLGSKGIGTDGVTPEAVVCPQPTQCTAGSCSTGTGTRTDAL
jgi:hypothetical protein